MPTCQVNNIDIDIIFSDSIEENIISINSKKELFFDVYECFINDEKLILEKVGDCDLGPKVLLEVNLDGKKYSAEAILVDEGKNYIELNRDNIYFIRTIPEENLTVEEKGEEEINIDNKTSDNIEVNYENIIEHHVNNKLVFLHELEEQFEEKIVSLKDDISDKLDLFFEKLEDKKKVIIEDKLNEISNELDEKFIVLKSELHGVEDFSKNNIDGILEKKINEIDKSVGIFLEGITKEYKNKIISSDKKITHNFLELNSIKDKLKENNILNNKKFEELNQLKEKLLTQDELLLKNKELKKFINEEFLNIDNKLKNLSIEENKKYNDLLAAVNNKDVVEYKTILKEKIQDVELTNIKEALQEEISDSLRGDIVSLKRYVEMSSGGGSIAKQFARGGTMDGDLTVVGNLSASNYLGIDSFDNGGTMNGDLTVTGNVKADTILATNLLSATTLDIGFELSGFNVTGNISASGGLSANNINVSGDILPSQTTTFNIGSTALRFKDIFLAGSTIDLSGTKISTDGEGDIEFRDKDNLTKRIKASEIILESPNDPDNDIVFKVDATGNPEFQKRRRSNPNIIEPSTTISDIVSAAQVRVRDVVGIGTSPSQLPNKPLTVVGEISATGNISTSNNLQLGGNIVDTDSNEIITIAANDVCFTGKSIRAGQSLGLRGVRGNCKGLDQSGDGDHTKLGIYNCSIEAITVDNAGKVGVGTTSPNEVLTINGSISGNNNLTVGNNITTIGNICINGQNKKLCLTNNSEIEFDDDFKITYDGHLKWDNTSAFKTEERSLHNYAGAEVVNFSSNDVTVNNANLVVSTGKVGVGTTSPNDILTVNGSISGNNNLTVDGNIASSGILSIGSTPAYSQTRSIKLFDNGVQYSARVSLIGTNDNSGPGLEMVTGGSLSKRTIIRHEGEGSNDYGLGFFTTNGGSISERVRFSGDGNVGIGRTDPSKLLDIKDGDFRISSTEPKIFLNDTNNNSDFSIKNNNGSFQISDTTNGPTRLAIDSSGNVGIGTTTPNEALTVVGDISATGTTNVGKITLTENTFLTAASSFTLGGVHKGATVLLQNTGSINITVPSQVAGYTTTFIAETHNPVSFISGTGLSGLNSFNGASDIAGIYGQAQVIYKSAEYAFLGGNIV